MYCSELNDEMIVSVYWQLIKGNNLADYHTNTKAARDYVEGVEMHSPELVAETLAKIRLEII
tara:strand:- start:321 stop:506 length:186 start_codon:yes stop_codon:yes gene_type:complete